MPDKGVFKPRRRKAGCDVLFPPTEAKQHPLPPDPALPPLAVKEATARSFGDAKATSCVTGQKQKHLYSSASIDYNPSRCKDFHDSGYCSWGDSCIYAHDRTNYKQGWELDREWEEARRKELEAVRVAAEPQPPTLPPQCAACKAFPTDPVTPEECDHVFCRGCAVNVFIAVGKCSTCFHAISGGFIPTPKPKA